MPGRRRGGMGETLLPDFFIGGVGEVGYGRASLNKIAHEHTHTHAHTQQMNKKQNQPQQQAGGNHDPVLVRYSHKPCVLFLPFRQKTSSSPVIGRVRVQMQEKEEPEPRHAELDRLHLGLLADANAAAHLLQSPQPGREHGAGYEGGGARRSRASRDGRQDGFKAVKGKTTAGWDGWRKGRAAWG